MSDQSGQQMSQASADDIAGKLLACQKERDEYLNGWKRAKADLINFQKDEQKRVSELLAFANATFAKDILAGMDSFDLALAAPGLDEGSKKGVLMIRSQFEEILKRHDIKRIGVKSGDAFDGKIHEAIGEVEIPPDKKELDGRVVEELVAGYMLGERVIRPTKVKVGKISL